MSKPSIWGMLEANNKLDQISVTRATLREKSFYITKGLSVKDKDKWSRKYTEYLKNCCPSKYEKFLERKRRDNLKYYHSLSEEQKTSRFARDKISQAKRMENNAYYNEYNKRKEARRKRLNSNNPESKQKELLRFRRYYYKKRAIKYNLFTPISAFIQIKFLCPHKTT